jgi:protein SCO1
MSTSSTNQSYSNKQEIIATHKIIVFIAFIMAALMTSVFIVHMKQKDAPILIAPEDGILFPVPRDIKPFTLTRSDEGTFSQKNLYGHFTLLFFGFTHCTNVCPANLAVLNRVYTQLHKTFPQLQVALISLDPERDTRAVLQQYVTSYNPAFIGASGKIEDLRQIQSQFGIFSAAEKNGQDYQLQHTPSILLISPEAKWLGLFHFGLAPEKMAAYLHTILAHA